MVKSEPQSAADYPARSTAAVRQTLVEIGQILGGYEGKFAVVGGAVPWLLLEPDDMVHVGTFDIDLALDPVALGDTEYADLVHALRRVQEGGHGRGSRTAGGRGGVASCSLADGVGCGRAGGSRP